MRRDEKGRSGGEAGDHDMAGDDFTEQMHDGEQQADTASGSTDGSGDSGGD